MKQYINEAKRWQKLANILIEAVEIPCGKEEINEGLQYFHNGADRNQIINYDDSDITDDLESFGQGSMDGQYFKSGETYNIGGQEYKIEPKGDEFKLVLAEVFNNLDEIVNKVLIKLRNK
jgi:hypothetical protein